MDIRETYFWFCRHGEMYLQRTNQEDLILKFNYDLIILVFNLVENRCLEYFQEVCFELFGYIFHH